VKLAGWCAHVGVLVLAVTAQGCCNKPLHFGPAPSASVAPEAPPSGDSEQVIDILRETPRCDVFHRGAFLDLGSASADSRFGFALEPPAGVTNITREGASWAQISDRSLSQSFYTDHPSPVFVSARVRGVSARQATVRIDGRVHGTLQFGRSSTEVVSTKVSTEPLEAGSHTLTLQFHGASRNQPFAELDWIRVGEPDEDPSTFAPPTERDLVIDAVIGNQPRRAVALRAPGTFRCGLVVREGMTLQATLGYAGPGSGEAELRIVEPAHEPTVVHAAAVGGEHDLHATVQLPLDTWRGKVVALELVAKKAAAGGRVLFGEPSISMQAATIPPRTPARASILVVLSSADRAHLPPYTDVPALAALTNLAASSVVFRHHRAVTTVVTGEMASLVTGLAPQVHAVMDAAARLPARFPTLGTVAHDGRVSSAMFSGNPASFEAFGFNRGWDKFEAFSPVSGEDTRTPLINGTRWIESHLQDSKDDRVLAVLHTRGGHPPWTATAEEIHSLPPVDYSGPVEARRAGQVLARARGKRSRWRLTAADRTRLEGFYALALIAEDQALGALIANLRKLGVWDSTLLVVTSDVAMGGAGRVPFGDGERLDEDLLEIPLIVHFPGGRSGGKMIDAHTSSLDLIETMLGALGLQAPDGLQGRDLYEIAANPERFALRPQMATLGREYATRLGELVLRGEVPKAPVLCDLTIGPGCSGPTPPSMAYVAGMLWRETFLRYRDAATGKNRASREPATLDPDTLAALTVWGYQETRP
jgi:arylsulfatase A-like enzyme